MTDLAVRLGPASALVRRRSLVVCAILLLACVVVTGVAVSLGSYVVPVGELIRIVLGGGPEQAATVVLSWRAPRAVLALAFGAALALSGAVFQSLTRNPLGSPDIIGFSTGALTGVFAVILLGGTGYATTAVGAFVGGLATTIVIYLLAWRRGVQGFRLIIVGIAVSALLTSVNSAITVKASLDIALRAAVWGAGSLNGVRWPQATPGLIGVAIFVALLVLTGSRLKQLELGDDTAAMLGHRVELDKVVLIVAAVGLIAVVTALSGPISFIALAAPQIAKRLVGMPSLLASALVGALLLGAADVLAQFAIPGRPVPVGAVTVTLGGLYLVWLLARETR
ncbi:FecCD family ABC transporter permease [Pseudactinotalea sp.]|uniref:FecCD family ABC transporter permease n=1 Tax=Pseudactinotalea sp. TaxID=1926260 RepID=UPI003B3B67A6